MRLDTKFDLKKKISFLECIHNLNNSNFNKLIILIKLIKKEYGNLTISIKSPNPQDEMWWGDYFFAVSLKKSLEKKGFIVLIHERESWNENSDIVIVLRGLIKYSPNPNQLNIMWNISHPNEISLDEYEEYDIVFIASNKYATNLSKKINTPVYPLLQCTDLDTFHPQKNNEYEKNEILFVGITRGVFRRIIKDMLKTDYDFSIYGDGWDVFVDEKYIKGKFIENAALKKAYSNCKILLNDHWEDMVENDFVSNRIYDALACKTFVISDYVESIQSLFGGSVITYNNYLDLNEKLNYYLTHEDERINLANKGYDIVKKHTFDVRVKEILSYIENIYYPYFISNLDSNSYNSNISSIKSNNISINLFNEFLNNNHEILLEELKLINIKFSRLQEKLFIRTRKK